MSECRHWRPQHKGLCRSSRSLASGPLTLWIPARRLNQTATAIRLVCRHRQKRRCLVAVSCTASVARTKSAKREDITGDLCMPVFRFRRWSEPRRATIKDLPVLPQSDWLLVSKPPELQCPPPAPTRVQSVTFCNQENDNGLQFLLAYVSIEWHSLALLCDSCTPVSAARSRYHPASLSLATSAQHHLPCTTKHSLPIPHD